VNGGERIKANETLHPIAMGLLGAQTVMLHPHHIAYLVDKLFLLAGGRGGFEKGVHGFGFYRPLFLEASPD